MTTFTRAAVVAAACTLLLTAPGRGQQDPFGGRARVVIQLGGLDGIDRGLRANDAPKDPSRDSLRAGAERVGEPVRQRPYRAGSVIVKFRSGTGSSAMASAMQTMRASSLARPSDADFEIMEIPPHSDPEAVSAQLMTRADVEYAQPRYFNQRALRPNDPLYEQQWNFPALDMERAWDIQPQAGDQVTVAVLDTGVAFQTATIRYNSGFPFRLESGGPVFPALGIVDMPFAVAPELGNAKFVAPRDFIWDDAMPFDLDGHGTHVSGTIGQLTNNAVGVAGMAYNVRIMPVKVIDEVWDFVFDSPNIGTDDVLARGVRYAVDNGARVINMSLQRTAGGPALVVEDAFRYAVSRGVFVVVAAGNTSERSNLPNRLAQAAPEIAGMVAVGAVGRGLDRAFYSTTNTYVEIAAPGGNQRSDGTTGGILQQTLDQDLLHTYELGPFRLSAPRADAFDYCFFQGTSMATPHVAALAALVIQQGITSPRAIEAAMKQFARDLGRPGVDSEFGSGLIQPRATLRGLGLAR